MKKALFAIGLVLAAFIAANAQVITAPGARFFGQHLKFSPDNTYDIGAIASGRPKTVYTGTGGVVVTGTGNGLTNGSFGKIGFAADGVVTLHNNALTDFARLQFGGTTSSFPALKRSGANILLRLADDSAPATIYGNYGTSNLLISTSTPTISSGFGTTPSVSANNGTAVFRVNVGTGGTANSGVIGLPTAATGWNCFCEDVTTRSATVADCKMTASTTTTATIGNFNTSMAAAAWVASDILAVSCFAY